MVYTDGGGAPLKAITDEEQRRREGTLRIEAGKHPASATETTQPCDVGDGFRSIKRLEKTMGKYDDYSASRPLKMAIETGLKQQADIGELNLPTAKFNCIVDFLARLPEVMTRACPQKSVVDSFINTGYYSTEGLRSREF